MKKFEMIRLESVHPELFVNQEHYERFTEIVKCANAVNDSINRGRLVTYNGEVCNGFTMNLLECELMTKDGVWCSWEVGSNGIEVRQSTEELFKRFVVWESPTALGDL